MIGSIYTEIARDAWATVPGRSMEFVNDANGNPTTITYKQGATVVFVKYLTYDANGDVTKIECKES